MTLLKNPLLFRIPAFLLLLLQFHPASAEFSIHGSNNVSIDAEGWIHPTDGDPYVMFRADGIDPEQFPILKIEVEGKHVLNRHSYAELFWATEQRGFSEEYKGFYVIPFSHKQTPIPVYLNFRDFIRALGDTSQRIDIIRLDLEPSLRETDFECRFKLQWLTAEDAAKLSSPVTAIHPPFLSRYLMKSTVIHYTLSQLTRDILQRIVRDWLFLVLYGGSIAVLLFLIWRTRKAPASTDS